MNYAIIINELSKNRSVFKELYLLDNSFATGPAFSNNSRRYLEVYRNRS
jgi:hypothetical protein